MLNKNVAAGQVIGWSGSTGPGGCGSTDGIVRENTHLHIFFAYKDATDDHWYFFDPYGIYNKPSCYPTGVNEAINGQCLRYPVTWKNGKPDYAVNNFAEAKETSLIVDADARVNRLTVSPNTSVGNIAVNYNSSISGKVNITIYDKTGLSISKKFDYAVKGDNVYRFNLSGVFQEYILLK